MTRTAVLVTVIVLGGVGPLSAAWLAVDRGMWPETWPEELEPLREASRTLTGSELNLTFYEIPFTSREDFEASWPHILKVRTEGSPITLFRPPHEYLGTLRAGVRIWNPAHQSRNIWLVVDGDIVDLNRIPLPPDTTIIDKRFDDRGDSLNQGNN